MLASLNHLLWDPSQKFLGCSLKHTYSLFSLKWSWLWEGEFKAYLLNCNRNKRFSTSAVKNESRMFVGLQMHLPPLRELDRLILEVLKFQFYSTI